MLDATSMDMGTQAAIWRELAKQTVDAAAQLHDPELRLSMLAIAASYEAMASRAEAMRQAASSDAG